MKVLCGDCHAMNRVSPQRLKDKKPVCGKCGADLSPQAPGYPVDISDTDFKAEVLQADVPVLVDLWGPTCPPCRQLAPLLKELAKDYAGRLKVAKLNVEAHPSALQHFQIRGIPTLLVFHGGQEKTRVAGFLPLPQLKALVEPFL